MADFHQLDNFTTLHNLKPDAWLQIEVELSRLVRRRPVGLVLPALYSEFENPAIHRILDELRRVQWLRRIVLVLSRADQAQYEHVCGFFDGFPAETAVLWREGPQVQDLFAELDAAGLPAAIPGKGRACWLGTGYLLAKGDCDVIAFQDCDVKTFHRRMLTRLVYPLVDPGFSFEFAKGYYPRFTERLNGRLTRLMLGPLVNALSQGGAASDFLRFLSGFRYGLSGEIGMDFRLARDMQLSPDWGLEISTLAEVHQRVPASRVCQVDLSDCYDHKHQPVSAADPQAGLHKMAREVAQAVFRAVAAEGGVLSQELLTVSLPLAYRRAAVEMVDRYEADARMNRLRFDRNGELGSVEVFARGLEEAGIEFSTNPAGVPALPAWRQVESALPGVMSQVACLAGQEPVWIERASA